MVTRILVTGGTGLFGNAIKDVLQTTEKRDNEEWFFVGSKDGDLTQVLVDTSTTTVFMPLNRF